RITRLWLLGLLFDAQNAAIRNLRTTKPLGVLHLFKNNMCPARLPPVTLGRFTDISLDDIIAKDYTNLLLVGKMLCEPQSVGNATFPFLVGVINMFKTKIFAVGKQA